MRFFLIAVLIITGGYNECYGQHYRKFGVSFTVNKKAVKNVNYYYLSRDTARLLKKIGDSILIDNNLLRRDSITFLVLNGREKIIFSLRQNFYYIEIERLKEKYAGLNRYDIRFGWDYMLKERESKRNIVIAK